MTEKAAFWYRLLASALIALTAILGGFALASGLEGTRFPTSWLSGTPFTSYLAPGLILAFVVGGSATVAFFLTLKRGRLARAWSVISGLCLSGFVLVEVIILKQSPPGPTAMEVFYLILALLLVVTGLFRRGRDGK